MMEYYTIIKKDLYYILEQILCFISHVLHHALYIFLSQEMPRVLDSLRNHRGHPLGQAAI